jgi:hypothetical protein
LGPQNLTNTILPNLLDLAKDPKWRVRKAVVDKMCLLAKALVRVHETFARTLHFSITPVPECVHHESFHVSCVFFIFFWFVQGAKTFEKRLQPVIIAALSDHVYAIRDKACVQMAGQFVCACVKR